MNVRIQNGLYRGHAINGVFEVVKPWVAGARNGYITVKAEAGAIFQTTTPRIIVEQDDFVLLDSEGNELSEQHMLTMNNAGELVTETNYEELFLSSETEEEAMGRIRHTFSMLDKVANSVARGIIRGVVISGPAGVGKSSGVESQLSVLNISDIGPIQPRFEVISGGISAIGLYQILWNNRAAGRVTCFDDSDGILEDEECLNLLKAALNSGERRRVCWNKESRVLINCSIPDAFDFHGGIIFLTNVDFEGRRGNRIADHLKAIVSRCHYMDLEIGSMRDKLLRIKQVVDDGMLKRFNFTNNEETMILNWINYNKDTLREVSLRMVIKIAELVAAQPLDWEEYAESTCLTREAKFRRLYAKKQEETAITEPVVEEVTTYSLQMV